MSTPADPVAQRLERARRPILPRYVRTERRGERIAQLGQRASEDLARRLELRAEAKEAERVVPRGIEAARELVDESEKPRPRLRVECRRPRSRVLGPAVPHVRSLAAREAHQSTTAPPIRSSGRSRVSASGSEAKSTWP